MHGVPSEARKEGVRGGATSMKPTPRTASSSRFDLHIAEHVGQQDRLQPQYSLRGSNPRPMAHKTIALTTELREPWCHGKAMPIKVPVAAPF